MHLRSPSSASQSSSQAGNSQQYAAPPTYPEEEEDAGYPEEKRGHGFDFGAPASLIAGALLNHSHLKIITNNLNVAMMLSAKDDFDVLLTWLLLNKTRLGLNVRAVTQNRNMAACCGVPTGRVVPMHEAPKAALASASLSLIAWAAMVML